MTDAARKLLDEAMALPARDRAQLAAALIASLQDEIIDVALDAEEWSLLRLGLNEWGGPARCTEEMAGGEWHITAGLSDEHTLALLRRVQRKLGREVRCLVGSGLGRRLERGRRQARPDSRPPRGS